MPLLDAAFCAILRNQSRAPICHYRVSAERIGLARESDLADDFLQNPRVNWPRTRGRWTCINQDALSTDQSFSVEACFWVRGRLPERNFLPWGQKLFGGGEGEPKMAQDESAAVRNANKHFRKEEQAKQGAAAWKEYLEQEDATRLKTARLRALRLARDAAAANNPTPPRKQAVRASAAKR